MSESLFRDGTWIYVGSCIAFGLIGLWIAWDALFMMEELKNKHGAGYAENDKRKPN